jgi:transposase
MIEALIDGQRRGGVLADLAKGRMRDAGALADLSMALTGRFTEHHALLCRLLQDRITGLDAAVAGGWVPSWSGIEKPSRCGEA